MSSMSASRILSLLTDAIGSLFRMTNAPGLGKYSEIVTAILTVILVVAAIAPRIFGMQQADLTFIDYAAALALGAVYGRTSAANGYAREARAAHVRLDKLGAPPAEITDPKVPAA
jgi:hypothetical protein